MYSLSVQSYDVREGECGAVQADNPGLWFYHCHILWHQLMGQGLVFAEGLEHIKEPPKDLPVCDQQCNYDFGGFTPSWVSQTYRSTNYDLPGIAADVVSP